MRVEQPSILLALAAIICSLPGHATGFAAAPSAGSLRRPCRTFEFRLVDHVDQLEQRREDGSTLQPPHLFQIPAPGGTVCLIVDERGSLHAVRDSCPPLGLPISESGIVDTQVGWVPGPPMPSRPLRMTEKPPMFLDIGFPPRFGPRDSRHRHTK